MQLEGSFPYPQQQSRSIFKLYIFFCFDSIYAKFSKSTLSSTYSKTNTIIHFSSPLRVPHDLPIPTHPPLFVHNNIWWTSQTWSNVEHKSPYIIKIRFNIINSFTYNSWIKFGTCSHFSSSTCVLHVLRNLSHVSWQHRPLCLPQSTLRWAARELSLVGRDFS